METKSRSIHLTQAVFDISSQVTRGSKSQPLTKESHRRLFVTWGSRISGAVASQKLEFETQLKEYMTFKRKAREEGSKGVSLPPSTIPLLELEIVSENLFQKNVYLKVNGKPRGFQGEEVFFSRIRSSRAASQFASYYSNGKRMTHFKYFLISIWF